MSALIVQAPDIECGCDPCFASAYALTLLCRLIVSFGNHSYPMIPVQATRSTIGTLLPVGWLPHDIFTSRNCLSLISRVRIQRITPLKNTSRILLSGACIRIIGNALGCFELSASSCHVQFGLPCDRPDEAEQFAVHGVKGLVDRFAAVD